MRIRTVLIEKDPVLLAQIENLLGFYHKFEIVRTFDDIDEASRYLLEEDADSAFIRSDVGDPARTPDGSFLLSYVTQRKPDLLAVLYSPSQDTAFWSLTVGATAAFTLPLDPLMFQRAVDRVLYLYDLLQYKRDAKTRSLLVKTKDGYRMLRLSDILFIERRERKKYIVCADGCEVTVSNYSMDDLTPCSAPATSTGAILPSSSTSNGWSASTSTTTKSSTPSRWTALTARSSSAAKSTRN